MIGWYFDVGNIVRYGWPEHWIQALGKRIIKIDIKDYSRKKQTGGTLEETVLGDYSLSIGAVRENRQMTKAGITGDHAKRDGNNPVFPEFKQKMKSGVGQSGCGAYRMHTEGNVVFDINKDFDLTCRGGIDFNAAEDVDLGSEKFIKLHSDKGTSISSSESVAISTDKEIVLSCGRAKIVLRADGQIILDGTSISELATGTARIKAKKIELN